MLRQTRHELQQTESIHAALSEFEETASAQLEALFQWTQQAAKAEALAQSVRQSCAHVAEEEQRARQEALLARRVLQYFDDFDRRSSVVSRASHRCQQSDFEQLDACIHCFSHEARHFVKESALYEKRAQELRERLLSRVVDLAIAQLRSALFESCENSASQIDSSRTESDEAAQSDSDEARETRSEKAEEQSETAKKQSETTKKLSETKKQSETAKKQSKSEIAKMQSETTQEQSEKSEAKRLLGEFFELLCFFAERRAALTGDGAYVRGMTRFVRLVCKTCQDLFRAQVTDLGSDLTVRAEGVVTALGRIKAIRVLENVVLRDGTLAQRWHFTARTLRQKQQCRCARVPSRCTRTLRNA
ncbi:MAG: hypothetical protein MHM6MM_008216 [Cercozoa sp. M6MM]